MNTNAKEQIEYIDRSLEWIKKHRPKDFDGKFLSLVEKRRELRKIVEAEQDNPAIAAYGESQVGKSYLMNNLLQKTTEVNGKKETTPFEIETLDGDGNVKKIPFIASINPKGGGTEATGVITRFSSFSKDKNRYSPKYPVLMKCLSISDIMLILCEGYYNNTKDSHPELLAMINKKAEDIYNKYIDKPLLTNAPISADVILDMKAYFMSEFGKAQNFNDSEFFFNNLAIVINRIPVEDYPELFAYLWHNSNQTENDAVFNNLYRHLLEVYKQLEYSKYIYLPIEAVLSDKGDEFSIMSVKCLNYMNHQDDKFMCNAYIKNSDGSFKNVGLIHKSALAAVCAEVILLINDEFLNKSASYETEGITDKDVLAYIKERDHLNYDLLKTTDLLDFPGGRTQEKKEGKVLEQKDEFMRIFRRGKVSYLFNKYSEAKIINILLFCHHGIQTNFRDLETILKRWIENYIGKSETERAKTISETAGISPFFFVSTKFNEEMSEDKTLANNDENGINSRWTRRFYDATRKEIFGDIPEDWVNKYIGEDQPFQNSYLLRSFSHSVEIYEGYKESNREKKLRVSNDYWELLRKSFCESKYVKLLFKNPTLSWDLATSMNNDGALYIIENLSKCASSIDTARSRQFKEQSTKIANSVLREIEDYYEPDDELQNLAKDKKSCREIVFKDLVDACDNDQIFFSFLLQYFQLKPEVCANYIRQEVIPNITTHSKEEGKFDMYHREYEFEKEDSRDERLQKLLRITGMQDEAEARTWFFDQKGINLDELLKSEEQSVSNSSVISKMVYKKWIQTLKNLPNLENYRSYDTTSKRKSQLDSGNFNKIKTYLTNAAEYVKLSKVMKNHISEVDGIGVKLDPKVPRISDILATIINNFVVDFGYEYLTEDEKKKAKVVFQGETEFLKKIDSITKSRKREEGGIVSFLKKVLDNDKSLKEPFLERYDKWVGCMLTAVVASSKAKINTPEIVAANAEIKPIIDGLTASI